MHADQRNSSMYLFNRKWLSIVIVFSLLSGCAATAITTVLVTSVDMALDRRTVGTYVDDNSVEVKIRRAINKDPQIGKNVHISVTTMNGIVLLTGEAEHHDQIRRAIGISRGYTEARHVVNQISITDKAKVSGRTKDSWITTKTKAAIVKARGVKARRIKVVTERGNVFLLGMVTTAEADKAVEAARGVRGVNRITKVFEYLP